MSERDVGTPFAGTLWRSARPWYRWPGLLGDCGALFCIQGGTRVDLPVFAVFPAAAVVVSW